jgi:hypothetical protein
MVEQTVHVQTLSTSLHIGVVPSLHIAVDWQEETGKTGLVTGQLVHTQLPFSLSNTHVCIVPSAHMTPVHRQAPLLHP